MQSLNALGNRQIASLNADLSRMDNGEGGPAIQGELRDSSTISGRVIDMAYVTLLTMNWMLIHLFQGQITTTLSALSRLIDDYDSMARKEMVTVARDKANT